MGVHGQGAWKKGELLIGSAAGSAAAGAGAGTGAGAGSAFPGAAAPPAGDGEVSDRFFEDDGHSEAYREQRCGWWQVKLIADSQSLTLAITRAGAGAPTASEVSVLLPRQETRRVYADSATVVADRIAGDWRELKVALT